MRPKRNNRIDLKPLKKKKIIIKEEAEEEEMQQEFLAETLAR